MARAAEGSRRDRGGTAKTSTRDEFAVSEPKVTKTPPRTTASESSLESTAQLLTLVRQGDAEARERLVARFLPVFKRWAHGRLPAAVRDLAETDDLVQSSLLRALDYVEGFEPRRPGAFLAYLRRILINQVCDEIRRSSHRPRLVELSEELACPGPTPFESAVSRESFLEYESARAALGESAREAVVMRLEFGLGYRDIADAIGSPSANAARMLIARALVHMAETMHGTR